MSSEHEIPELDRKGLRKFGLTTGAIVGALFGLLMSKVTTPVILGLVFYAVITPMSLVMRLAGKDYMARRLDRKARSYRIESPATPPQRLEKPF